MVWWFGNLDARMSSCAWTFCGLVRCMFLGYGFAFPCGFRMCLGLWFGCFSGFLGFDFVVI